MKNLRLYYLWRIGVALLMFQNFAFGEPFKPGSITLTTGKLLPIGSLGLIMQDDGNLVLYPLEKGKPVLPAFWASNTVGLCKGCLASYQDDGNLVVYNMNYVNPKTKKIAPKPIFASNTMGSAGVTFSSTAPFVTFSDPLGNQFSTQGGTNRATAKVPKLIQFLPGSLDLPMGKSISAQAMKLIMQDDSNLVLYPTANGIPNGPAIWASNTVGACRHCEAKYETDGNLYIYNSDTNQRVYASDTTGSSPLTLSNKSGVAFTNIAPADITTCPTPRKVVDSNPRTESYTSPLGTHTISIAEPNLTASSTVVSLAPCNLGKQSTCDYDNVFKALQNASGGLQIDFSGGDYYFNPHANHGAAALANIPIIGTNLEKMLTDVLLEGPDASMGTQANFHFGVDENGNNVNGIAIRLAQRIEVKNITIDFMQTTAIPGTIKASSDPRNPFRFYVAGSGSSYVSDTTHPPAINNFYEFNFQTRNYAGVIGDQAYWNTSHVQPVFNPNFSSSGPDANQYFYVMPPFPVPGFGLSHDGKDVIAVARDTAHGAAVYVTGEASDVSLENVWVYSAPGMGFVFANAGQNFRLTGCKVVRRPDIAGEMPRFISTVADATHFRNTLGSILIENSEFANQGDDGLNLVGAMISSSYSSGQVSSGPMPWPYNPTALTTSFASQLYDPSNFAGLLSPMPQATYVRPTEPNPGSYAFSLHSIPDLSEGSYIFNAPNLSSPNFVVTNSCYHDSVGRGMLIQTQHGRITNNTVSGTFNSGMLVQSDLVQWNEGPGGGDLLIDSNRIFNTDRSAVDVDEWGHVLGYLSGRLSASVMFMGTLPSGYYPTASPNHDISFQNNTIVGSAGAGLLVSSTNNISVQNNSFRNTNTGSYLADYGQNYCQTPAPLKKFNPFDPACPGLMAAPSNAYVLVNQATKVSACGNNYLAGPHESAKVFIGTQNCSQ